MSKKKLLFICGKVSPTSSQGVRYLNILPHLSRHFHLTILSFNEFIHIENSKTVLISKKGKSKIKEKKIRINVKNNIIKLYKKVIRPFIFPDKYIFYQNHYKKAIKALLSENDYSFVLVGMTPFSLLHLAKYIKSIAPSINVIGDFSDPFAFNGTNKYILFSKKRIIAYEKSTLKYFDAIVVLNNKIKDIYQSRLNFKNANVIEQGFERKALKISKEKSNCQKINLLYAGGLYSGFREAFELYKVVNNSKNYYFKIYGNISNEMLPSKSFLNISYNGVIPNSELQKEYALADVIIFIDNKLGYQVPGKLLEIQQFGIPILFIYYNINSPSFEYLFNDNIITVLNKKEDIEAGLKQIKTLINTKRISDILQNFSWDRLAKKYISIIDD